MEGLGGVWFMVSSLFRWLLRLSAGADVRGSESVIQLFLVARYH